MFSSSSASVSADAVSERWNTNHRIENYRARFLREHPVAKRVLDDLYLGGLSALALLAQSIGREVESALELAGGRGDFSISLLTSKTARRVRMLDLSDEGVAIALRRADELGVEGLEASVKDVNELILNEEYDLIACSQSLHHISALERVADQVRGALSPGGVFFVSDYIGPSRMQWTDQQLEWMNTLLIQLPESLRKTIDSRINGSAIKNSIGRIPLSYFEEADPSEAVRSDEIKGILMSAFPVVDFWPLGGGISYELFRGIIHNFDPDNEAHNALIRSVLAVEQLLTNAGTIPSCFGVFICRNR